ncbi:hypothetical protein BKA64DRAFT_680697 [Cadophora sp. MPI-SDFR-AT-0126]|nr:hypothetical protein BKA64DRAFT_680697 [Leotiomycetes sp. MPI-SDFR-AT-0126]
MASRLRVAVAGATGETGRSVVDALLTTPDKFEVIALARPESVGKQVLVDFSERGAIVKSVDLTEVTATVVGVLTGMDVVIACLTLAQYQEQMILIEASSRAKVKRYVPGFFAPPCPPRGVSSLREKKEDMFDRIRCLYLPFTVIDVGWWYQLSLPPLPSGRLQTRFELSTLEILGDGEVPSALIDNRDIGKYVARIIADPRTLNKMVFAYSEVWTQNGIWTTLETLSGEPIAREHLSKEDLSNIISQARTILSKAPEAKAQLQLAMSEYKMSMGIRGDNTPEHGKYLGYLDAKELYLDVKTVSLKTFIEEMLQGKVRQIYSS